MRILGFVLAVLIVFGIGCGGVDDKAEKVTPPAAGSEVKGLLEGVATSGQLGSGGGQIRSKLEELKATDSGKATGLLSDLDALEKATDPNDVKAKAKAMAGKL